MFVVSTWITWKQLKYKFYSLESCTMYFSKKICTDIQALLIIIRGVKYEL